MAVADYVGADRPDGHAGSDTVQLYGRTGGLAGTEKPRHPAAGRRLAAGADGRHPGGDSAVGGISARRPGASDPARQLPDAYPLAGAPLSVATKPGFLSGRLRRPDRHQSNANRPVSARNRDEAAGCDGLHPGVLHFRPGDRGHGRLAFNAADAGLVAAVHCRAGVFCTAAETGGHRAGGCPLGHDRPHCRQLYQYSDGETVFPH